MEWHTCVDSFSGLGYIVGANVAKAIGTLIAGPSWQWSLRVSL